MVNNLRFKLIGLFLFLYFVSFGASLKDTLFSEKQLVDSINSHLTQLFIQNYKNDKNGESFKNRYVLFYNYGKPVDLLSCTIPYIAVGPHQEATSIPNINAYIAQSHILDSLCDFNNNVGGINWANIKHYAIYYGFPNSAGKTRLTDTLASQSAIVPFMDQIGAKENFSSFSNARRDIENYIYASQKLPDEILNAEHRILTVQSIFDDALKPNASGHRRTVTTKTYFVKDNILTDQVFRNYISFCSDSSKFTKPGPFFNFKGPYYIEGGKLFQRIWGFIEFFKNITNFNNDYNACTDIPATHIVAKKVRDCYCGQVTNNITQKNGLYDFVSTLDNMIVKQSIYGPYTPYYYAFINSFNCDPPGTDFINTVFSEYLTNSSAYTFSEFLLKEKIAKSTIAPNDVSKHAYTLWLSMSKIGDFEKMNVNERMKFLKIFKEQHSGGTFYLHIDRAEGNGQISLTQIIQEIVINVQGQSNARELIDSLTANGPLLRWIYDEVCNDLFVNDNSEHKVIHAFNRLFEKSEGGENAMKAKTKQPSPGTPALWDGMGIVWQPGPWYYNPDLHYDYETLGQLPYVNDAGKVSFQTELFIDGGIIGSDPHIEEYLLKDPFTPCPISIGDNFCWMTEGGFLQDLTDCSARGGMDCGRARFVPIIAAAWYIDKLNETKFLAGAMAAIETAAMFTGVGTYLRLVKLTGDVSKILKIRRALAGFSAATTAADLVIPNSTAIVLSQYSNKPQSEINDIQNNLQAITTVFAMAGGIAQLGDFIYGLSKWQQLKNAISGPASADRVKIMEDVGKFINDFPDQTTKLLKELGLTDDAVRSVVNSTTNLNHRVMLIGELADPAFEAHRNNEKVAKLIKLLLQDENEIFTHYGELSATSKAALFKDIKAGNYDALFSSFREEAVLECYNRLKAHNLVQNMGNADVFEVSNIHRYTANSDYINVPMRGPFTEPLLSTPDITLPKDVFRSYQVTLSGLAKLRATNRLRTNFVNRGRAFSQAHFDELFGAGSPSIIPLKGFQSCTNNVQVAEEFAGLASFPGQKVRMIIRIKSKDGVFIDDFADYGENLGPLYHNGSTIQEEVLLLEGKFQKLGNPMPYLVNGVQKFDTEIPPNPYMFIELEELGIPIRNITSQ